MSKTSRTSPSSPPPGHEDQSARLAASAWVDQEGGTYRRLFLRPFSLSSWFSTSFTLKIAQMARAAIAITAASIQGAYANSASSASICDPFNPQLVGWQLFKLFALGTAISFFVILAALLVRDAIHGWINVRQARRSK